MSEPSFFEQSLSNFAFDVASGGAIRHLASLHYPVSRIAQELTFHAPIEKIQKVVWQYYLDEGIISYENPLERKEESYHIIKEQDAYGKISFRKVYDNSSEKEEYAYVETEIGTYCYSDREAFDRLLLTLSEESAMVLKELPWQKGTCFVREDFYRRIV